MPPDRIETMRTYFWAAGHKVDVTTFARAMLAATKAATARRIDTVGIVPAAARGLLDIELGDPSQPIEGDPVFAYVNDGNWIWKCECSGAEFVDSERPVGMCCSCWNARHGHQWRCVILPLRQASIEAVLLARPNRRNRNWRPHETLLQLARENRAHGLPLRPQEAT